MSETENQELSMEDILSSIKDILQNEENIKTADTAPVLEEVRNTQETVIDFDGTPLELDNSDIFNLSEEQMIQNIAEIDLDSILDDSTTSTDNIDLETLLGNERSNESIIEEENFNIPESFINFAEEAPIIPEAIIEEMPIILEAPIEETSFDLSNLEDFKLENDETIFFPTDVAIEAPISAEKDSFEDPIIDLEEPILLPTPVVDFVEENSVNTFSEPVINFEAEIIAEPVIDFVESVKQQEADVMIESVVEEPKADISSEIISNFAQMFSKTQPEVKPEIAEIMVPKENLIATGDMSKTLENMVLEVITQNISSINIDALVRSKAEELLKDWLSQNLNHLTETIIKEELAKIIQKNS